MKSRLQKPNTTSIILVVMLGLLVVLILRSLRLDQVQAVGGHTPDHVLGNLFNAMKMTVPSGVAYDSVHQLIFVSDNQRNRVLVFDDSDGITDSEIPIHVLGQPDFDTTTAATTAAGMAGPQGLSYDSVSQRLFVSDSGNRRVLVFNLSAGITNGMAASNELGQTDDNANADFFDDATLGVTSATGLVNPAGLSYDSTNQRLFVSDLDNSRVLIFNLSSGITNGMAAANVLGQVTFDTADQATTQTGMISPDGLAYDSVGHRLFVADAGNNRILVFDVTSITDGEPAISELGQIDANADTDFFNDGDGGGDAIAMSDPRSLAYDSTNQRLFVADANNNRVTVFDLTAGITNGMAASQVLGASDLVSSGFIFGATGVFHPWGLAYDSSGQRLFVAEQDGSRVTVFDVASITDGESAVTTLGRPSSGLTTASDVGPSASVFDPIGQRLFVADIGNNRVLVYNSADGFTDGEPAVNVLGQANFTDKDPATTATGMSEPQTMLYDSINHRLFVADSANNRVLVFNLSFGITNGMAASFELGQTDDDDDLDFFNDSVAATTAMGMSAPSGLSYDSINQRLFVVDQGNNRILVFDLTTGITNGMAASQELGQTDADTDNDFFNDAVATTTQVGMSTPIGLFSESTNHRLFVADANNNRILVFDLTTGITNGMAASQVIGQSDFTSASTATTQNRLSGPFNITMDEGRQLLYVADTNNNRVLVFDLSSGISDDMGAIDVYGQSDFVTSGPGLGDSNFNFPESVSFDAPSNALFVSDAGNSRVVIYTTAIATPTPTPTSTPTPTPASGGGGIPGPGPATPTPTPFPPVTPRSTLIPTLIPTLRPMPVPTRKSIPGTTPTPTSSIRPSPPEEPVIAGIPRGSGESVPPITFPLMCPESLPSWTPLIIQPIICWFQSVFGFIW